MKRRYFIKQGVSATAIAASGGYALWDIRQHSISPSTQQRAQMALSKVVNELNPTNDEGGASQLAIDSQNVPNPQSKPLARPAIAANQQSIPEVILDTPSVTANVELPIEQTPLEQPPVEEIVLTQAEKAQAADVKIAKGEDLAGSLREKIERFEVNYTDDVILNEQDYAVLVQTLERINRVQDYVGFGNFNILSFDELLKHGKYSPRVGAFEQAELDFMDMLFAFDSKKLGFFGEKVIDAQTNVISKNDVVKIPGSGHYVFKGHSEVFYNKLRTEVGDSLILTSGIRNIAKQYQLFLAKTVQSAGNLSRASRSLAPPGHSYHAIGDFDVGRINGGFSNFSAEFAETDEFKRLQDLGYVEIRYTADNKLGVRYEPWHIRVV